MKVNIQHDTLKKDVGEFQTDTVYSSSLVAGSSSDAVDTDIIVHTSTAVSDPVNPDDNVSELQTDSVHSSSICDCQANTVIDSLNQELYVASSAHTSELASIQLPGQWVQLYTFNSDGSVISNWINVIDSTNMALMNTTVDTAAVTTVIASDPQNISEVAEGASDITMRSRKRKREPHLWKQTIRKRLRQSGEEYLNSRGKVSRAKSVTARPRCYSCRFKCCQKVSVQKQAEIHSAFWGMSDSAKNSFFEQTTTRVAAKRISSGINHRKKFSYKYYLTADSVRVRVCKKFYLSCLDISQRRITYYHETVRNASTGTA